MLVHRVKAMGEHRERVAIGKPRREASGEKPNLPSP